MKIIISACALHNFSNILFVFYLLNDVRRYNYSKRSTVRYNYRWKETRRVKIRVVAYDVKDLYPR